MSDQIRDLVETPHAHDGIRTARNLSDAANSGQSLQGYAAVNGLTDDSDIARRAYELFEERQQVGEEGSADGDWFRAEEEVRRGRMASKM